VIVFKYPQRRSAHSLDAAVSDRVDCERFSTNRERNGVQVDRGAHSARGNEFDYETGVIGPAFGYRNPSSLSLLSKWATSVCTVVGSLTITLDDASGTTGRNFDARLRDRTIVNDRF
jgi:hypothetical protein